MPIITTTVRCTNCSALFPKSVCEIKRSKYGRHFCGRPCSIAWHRVHRHLPNGGGSTSGLVPGNLRDELTPFRYFLRRAEPRSIKSGKGYNLDLEYVKELWDDQGGICPFTGWSLQLPVSTRGFANGRLPRNASLDRIDASKGYTKGNVRYVALIVNMALSNWGDEAVYELAEAVVQNRAGKDST